MNQKQILCIEDEAAIVLPLRYALEREDFGVITDLRIMQKDNISRGFGFIGF